MIKLVISGGDSFTFGSELKDTNGEIAPSKNCWANLIANKLNAKHCNTGRGARSNSFITRHVIYKVHQALRLGFKPEEIFVQIMLTTISRSEIAVGFNTKLPFDSPWFPLYPHVAEDESKSEWVMEKLKQKIAGSAYFAKLLHKEYNLRKEQGLVDFAKHHYMIATDTNDTYISLKSILLLQNFLENRNIKHFFTYIKFQVWDGLINVDPHDKFLNSLRDNIKFDDWYTFPGQHIDYWNEETIISPYGFDDWAQENKYEYGVGHPMEKGHKEAAELLYEKVKKILETKQASGSLGTLSGE